MTPADSTQPGTIVRFAGPAGLALLVILNLCVLAFIASDVYVSHRAGPLIIQDAKGMQEAFDAYKDRVDVAQKLITALIGLSSLYALTLGFTTFLSAQQYLQTLKSNAEESKKSIEDAAKERKAARREVRRLREKFPTFDRMDTAIEGMVERLQNLLPDTEWILRHYKRMKPEQHEEVFLYEKSAALLEVLNPAAVNPKTRELFLRLSKYYRARFEFEKSSQPGAQSNGEWLERSRFYLTKYAHAGEDFVSLTERGIIDFRLMGKPLEARPLFKLSIDKEPRQQRAYYWLSIVEHGEKEYALAEKLLSAALLHDKWERQSNPECRYDILYNRACAWSRLAEIAVDPAARDECARKGIQDLEDACPGPDEFSLKVFTGDTKAGEDLAFLLNALPARVEAIGQKLKGV